MADYDSNIIKPVDNLQNVKGLAPTRRREERSRRQKLNQDNPEQQERPDENVDEQAPEEILENRDENGLGGSRIDYRA